MKRLSIIMILTVICVHISYGQDKERSQNQKLLEKANGYYSDYNFTKAIEIYEDLADKDSRTAIRKLGDCYRMMNDLQSAKHYYALAVEQNNINPIYYFYYAQSLMNSGEYSDAKTWFEAYQAKEKDSPLADNMIKACELALSATENQTPFELISLDLNSDASDFGPSFYRDGIIFTSSRIEGIIRKKDTWTNTGYLDVYHAPVTWQPHAVIAVERIKGSVNTLNYHDGPACLNSEGNRIFFTRNNVLAGDEQVSRSGEVKLKIYSATRIGDGFKNVEELSFNGNEYSCAHPSVNYNESIIFYASDKGGGFGGTDIYYSTYDFNKMRWSKPINAGEQINTAGDERFPFIHEDGTLYFSSNGHLGYGGLDIYASSPLTKGGLDFLAARNLGKPFNSEGDDFSYIVDVNKITGFFASNRTGGKGDDDIYQFTSATTPLSIHTESNDTIQANVWITLYDIDRNITLQQDATNSKGSFYGRLQPNSSYMLIVKKKGFETIKYPMETGPDNTPLERTFTLIKSEAEVPNEEGSKP